MQDKFSIAAPLEEIFSNYSDLIPPIEPFIANMAEMLHFGLNKISSF
jgi:hypothetical protein